MQIVEVSVVGVRSAALRVRRHGTPLWFTLFPMIHVAQPAFYEEVANRLRAVDMIVAEGIKGEAPSIGPISRLYEQFSRGPGPQIVVQDIDYESLGPPVLNPDLTGDELDRRLRQQVPLADRLLMRASLPVAGLAVRLMGPQLLMDRYLGLEDLPTAEQERWADAGAEFEDVIVHQRDALANQALADIYGKHQQDEMHVAVVYGAGHIVGIFRYLSQTFRYRVVGADWLDVYPF
ncbi:MAG TPA: hypothetical protein VKB37_06885 [Jatrophihabitantaceae bacterium]|nr:hypothetical protein [Jatrophihabitantaceae bacterium]